MKECKEKQNALLDKLTANQIEVLKELTVNQIDYLCHLAVKLFGLEAVN
jgi:hypothetical protein